MALKFVHPPERVIVARNGRLFSTVNDLTILIAAIARATGIPAGLPSGPMPAMRIRGPNAGAAFLVPLHGPIEHAMMGTLPDYIEIGVALLPSKEDVDDGVVAQTTGLAGVFNHLLAPIFLSFFERYNVWLRDALGDAVHWPMTLNFARVVRNAAAHGRIDIRNPSAPTVSWKGLSYSYADKGKALFGSDITLAEVLALMIESDSELDKLSAPIL